MWCVPGGASGKEPTCQAGDVRDTGAQSLGQEDPLEEGMATQSSILAWRIPWTEKPTVYGVAESDMTEHLSTAYRFFLLVVGLSAVEALQ